MFFGMIDWDYIKGVEPFNLPAGAHELFCELFWRNFQRWLPNKAIAELPGYLGGVRTGTTFCPPNLPDYYRKLILYYLYGTPYEKIKTGAAFSSWGRREVSLSSFQDEIPQEVELIESIFKGLEKSGVEYLDQRTLLNESYRLDPRPWVTKGERLAFLR